MKVLHDWDEIPPRVDWARRRGISLLLYSLANKFPMLKRIKRVAENTRKIEDEKLAYMETLIRLDHIAGITPIFGIRSNVMKRYGREIGTLKEVYGIDVRAHLHIRERPDPDRKRIWIPPLCQSQSSWSFDYNFVRGIRVKLADGELPIFHVDHPEYLAGYVDYIFEEQNEIV